MRSSIIRDLICAVALVTVTSSAPGADKANRDESKVAPYTLPPLLVCNDTTTVTTGDQWTVKRRPEILDLFSRHVYGLTPASPDDIEFAVSDVRKDALGGLATRKQIHISLTSHPQWPGMDVLLYVPNHVRKPPPVILGLNFSGNHAVTTEPGVLLSGRWMRDNKAKGVVNNRATEASRGVERNRWSLEMILRRGYAVATAYYGDLEPDHPEGWKDGIRAALSPEGARTRWKNDDWGAIGAWSWGLSRMLDYCVSDRQIDGKRAIVFGHSRLGKTALWAGARDERFALAISNNSGEGGAALARRNYGETLRIITTSFPHWFCPAYASWVDRVHDLPVDQHMLIALMAPRPIYIASAQKDEWADPRGEFLSGLHAGEVYELFGKTGIGTTTWPSVNRPLGDYIGYHIRTGEHDVTGYDWEQYLNFADRHLRERTP